jgi:hypothetical protein
MCLSMSFPKTTVFFFEAEELRLKTSPVMKLYNKHAMDQ